MVRVWKTTLAVAGLFIIEKMKFMTKIKMMNRILSFFILLIFFTTKQKKQRHQRMKPRRKQPRFIINDEIENTKRCDIYNTNK